MVLHRAALPSSTWVPHRHSPLLTPAECPPKQVACYNGTHSGSLLNSTLCLLTHKVQLGSTPPSLLSARWLWWTGSLSSGERERPKRAAAFRHVARSRSGLGKYKRELGRLLGYPYCNPRRQHKQGHIVANGRSWRAWSVPAAWILEPRNGK